MSWLLPVTWSGRAFGAPTRVSGRKSRRARLSSLDGAERLEPREFLSTVTAVFRPATDQWIIASPGGGRVEQFGDPAHGDVPVDASNLSSPRCSWPSP
jgi:hypothetical protein